MAWTYRDYEWIVSHYPWMETSVSVALVRDASVDVVLDAITVSDEGSETGLVAVNNRDVELVGVAAIADRWTIAVSSTAWSMEDVPTLSADREIVHFSGVLANYSFSVWNDGERVSYCDPLLRCGSGPDDSVPEPLRTLMQQAGFSIESNDEEDTDGRMADGKFHIVDGCIAMVANHTGVSITPDFLESAAFEVGSVRY
ncbi:MAG: hypothetical protein C0482_00990 [Gordonia sp.]|nr:hypothetical protein [Gordonia sp. (in: high G+C Gram-positive bacteria)]